MYEDDTLFSLGILTGLYPPSLNSTKSLLFKTPDTSPENEPSPLKVNITSLKQPTTQTSDVMVRLYRIRESITSIKDDLRSIIKKITEYDTPTPNLVSTSAPTILNFINTTTTSLNAILSTLPQSPDLSDEDKVVGGICRVLLFDIQCIGEVFDGVCKLDSKVNKTGVRTAGGSVRYIGREDDEGKKGGRGYRRRRIRNLILGDDLRLLVEEGRVRTEEEEEEEKEERECTGGVERQGTIVFGREREEEEVEEEEEKEEEDEPPPPQQSTRAVKGSPFKPPPTPPPQPPPPPPSSAISSTFKSSMMLESALLPSRLHTKLDDVSTLETSMSAVTTLLSAFTNIVEEQSEVVGEINRQAITAVGEVEKGGGELKTAKKHIENTSWVVPCIIVIMGWSLLFVNWFTP